MLNLKLPDKDLSDGITQLIRQQEDYCLQLLQNSTAHNRHETVHELRKTLKKLRAIFKFIRDEIGEENYKEENKFYRDLGRQISELRDSTAILESLQQLKAKYQPELADQTFEMPLKSLQNNRQKLAHKYLKQEKRLENMESQLKKKVQEHKKWDFNTGSFEKISLGVKRVYARGRKAFHKSKQTKETQDLHDWRKRVKYLRYQHDIISVIWPRVIKAHADELDRLGDFLGQDHDLAVLQEQITSGKVKFNDEAEKGLLAALISYSRDQLQQKALLLGANFYQDSAENFILKINSYWENYQAALAHKSSESIVDPE